MNLLEKVYVLFVSDQVRIWHYPHKKDNPKFYYYLTSEPENIDGYGFDSLDEMIESAYSHIDPLKKPLPPLNISE